MVDKRARAGERQRVLYVCAHGDNMSVVVLLTVIFYYAASEGFSDSPGVETMDTSWDATFVGKFVSLCVEFRRLYGMCLLFYYLHRFLDDSLLTWFVVIYYCIY